MQLVRHLSKVLSSETLSTSLLGGRRTRSDLGDLSKQLFGMNIPRTTLSDVVPNFLISALPGAPTAQAPHAHQSAFASRSLSAAAPLYRHQPDLTPKTHDPSGATSGPSALPRSPNRWRAPPRRRRSDTPTPGIAASAPWRRRSTWGEQRGGEKANGQCVCICTACSGGSVGRAWLACPGAISRPAAWRNLRGRGPQWWPGDPTRTG